MDNSDTTGTGHTGSGRAPINYPSFIADPPAQHEFSQMHPNPAVHQHEDAKKVMEHHHDAPADYTGGKIITGIPTVPVTQERRPYVPPQGPEHHGKGLQHAGVPRANVAASAENPYGTNKDNYSSNHRHETVLQQHCAFFDRDKDGVVWPIDTYVGFRRLGFNIFISLFAMFIIHVNFSYPSSHNLIPDIYFRVWLDNIHKCKHGSDTNTYDNEGRFVPQSFENFFEKHSSVSPQSHAVGRKGEAGSAAGDGGPNQSPGPEATKKGITYYDVLRGWNAQRMVFDPIGWSAEFLEWTATYLLLWPEDGVMRKEDIRRVYDGSIFWDIAERREKSRMKKKGILAGTKSSNMVKLKNEKEAEFSGGRKKMAGNYLGDMGRQKVFSTGTSAT